jgi:molybdopterin-biosynthesis enzyme MoeA-like protein
MGRRLAMDDEALALIREHYRKRGMADMELTPARKKMAMIPEGAQPLVNPAGTAPGVRLAAGDAVIFCLPGVPLEMRGIFRRSVEPEVRASVGELARAAILLKLEGIYESAMAPLIKRELQRNPGAYIKSHPRGLREGVSRIELDIVVVGKEEVKAKEVASGIARRMIGDIEKAGGSVRSAKGPE